MNDPAMENGFIAIAEGLTKHFPSGGRTVRAVDGVDFRIARGRMVALRGPSGCGKSTLLNLIGALDKPDSGQLQVDGVDVRRLSGGREVSYRRRKVGFVFQQFNLIPQLSALENVTLPMELAGDNGRNSSDLARQLLRQVGLDDGLHDRRPARLSGGEQQRVAIARALANDPPIILADEPTANLDSKTGRLIIELLQALRGDQRTVIIATHDVDIASRADSVLEMMDGQIVRATGG
ncbi:MAG: ABC transporter ATP-binding protein [Chloroflexi bacterium]|nr:MAG: ABC transporter ATP-binding protein [Chloroflexota bacterium]